MLQSIGHCGYRVEEVRVVTVVMENDNGTYGTVNLFSLLDGLTPQCKRKGLIRTKSLD